MRCSTTLRDPPWLRSLVLFQMNSTQKTRRVFGMDQERERSKWTMSFASGWARYLARTLVLCAMPRKTMPSNNWSLENAFVWKRKRFYAFNIAMTLQRENAFVLQAAPVGPNSGSKPVCRIKLKCQDSKDNWPSVKTGSRLLKPILKRTRGAGEIVVTGKCGNYSHSISNYWPALRSREISHTEPFVMCGSGDHKFRWHCRKWQLIAKKLRSTSIKHHLDSAPRVATSGGCWEHLTKRATRGLVGLDWCFCFEVYPQKAWVITSLKCRSPCKSEGVSDSLPPKCLFWFHPVW